MLLEAKGLAIARGGLRVLEGLNLNLAPGEVLVLRGANGIGKTTLLRTLAGLQLPQAGSIEGQDCIYSGHADGLKSALSVRENLAFWASIYGHSGVSIALHAMNLSDLAMRRAGDLSAGQKRRLGLARLLVAGPAVWLLDEPTVSLDAASVGLFAEVLRGHLQGGGAAIIATHIDLGLPEARVMDLTPFRALDRADGAFDQAFDGAFL